MRISQSNEVVLAITLGDPGGIGPEVVLKSFTSEYLVRHLTGQSPSDVFFLCIGNSQSLVETQEEIGTNIPLNILKQYHFDGLERTKLNVLEVKEDSLFERNVISKTNGSIALASIQLAADLAKQQKIHGLVTAPISKEACGLVKRNFKGHTDWLAEMDRVRNYAMMLTSDKLSVVLASIHIPISQVPKAITSSGITEKICLATDYFQNEKGISQPRIGVAALNPHSGEGGMIGREEGRVILPGIEEANRRGCFAEGPIPADTLFYKAYQGDYDAVVCMYHDQGLGPLKMISFDDAINVTLGLSYIRTSPDHGTAFDIAFQNKANPLSMTKAIWCALECVERHKVSEFV